MKVVVVGLGIQGAKRLRVAKDDVVATVDPTVKADYRRIEDVPGDRYDAALVCAPDAAKPAILKALLTRGKHVLVEKPLLTKNISELKKLKALASSNRVACYTAYNHRFEPHLVRLKEIVSSGVLGPLYLAKFFYGNGTARDVRGSVWRDRGAGVITDLGSHLADLTLFLFGRKNLRLKPATLRRFENRAYDYAFLISDAKPLIQFEMTLLSWKNTFRAEIYGKGGSVHVDGLCKWGPSTLTLRKRKLPSGRPVEETDTLVCPDPTWEKEYGHFKSLCSAGKNNLGNDLWIRAALGDFV